MKKYQLLLIFAVFISGVSASTANAQADTIRPAHIGFWYPLSSNGTKAGEYTNRFSFHVLTGLSRNETSFSLAGLANVVRRQASGVQIAGFANYIGQGVSSVQLAGFGNMVKQETSGAQIAGFMNMAGEVRGAQVAGFSNFSRGNVKGAQVAGFMNLSGGDVTSTQVAGFMNKSRAVHSQVGGFMNLANRTKGVQVAGFINRSESVHSQVSGFMNIAGNVRGVQVAGFINIADSSNYPIGLLNLIRNGEKGLGVTIDETATTVLAFRSGGRILYGILGAGYNLKYASDHYYALEAGLGANWPISPAFRLKGEIVHQALTDFKDEDNAYFKSTFRLLPAFRFGNRFEIFAGPTLNYTYSDNDHSREFVKKYLWKKSDADEFQGIHLGVVGGIQILL